jgi:geranylgeranyl diphosphate synthase type II
MDDAELAHAAAAAIEMLHCASLVTTTCPASTTPPPGVAACQSTAPSASRSPCWAGDALIVLAFQTLARARPAHRERIGELVELIGDAVGTPLGIVAGQAWECEHHVDVAAYHRAKTAALFAGATMAGAAAAGGPVEIWRAVGERLGEAYQVADDIGDALADEAQLGKPVGQDVAHGRPNAVRELGVRGAIGRLNALTEAAVAAIPDCAGAAALGALIRQEAHRLLPRPLPAFAA